jgi:hypothetical protein
VYGMSLNETFPLHVQEHSMILTAHRKPSYNREKRNPSPIAKDFRWAQHR